MRNIELHTPLDFIFYLLDVILFFVIFRPGNEFGPLMSMLSTVLLWLTQLPDMSRVGVDRMCTKILIANSSHIITTVKYHMIKPDHSPWWTI